MLPLSLFRSNSIRRRHSFLLSLLIWLSFAHPCFSFIFPLHLPPSVHTSIPIYTGVIMVNMKANVFCFSRKWDSLLCTKHFGSNYSLIFYIFHIFLPLLLHTSFHSCLSSCFMTCYTKPSHQFFKMFHKFQTRWGLSPQINCTWHKLSECFQEAHGTTITQLEMVL